MLLGETEATLELHTEVDAGDDLGGDVRPIWERSQPASLGGVPARVLHPFDLLTNLCLHVSAHHLFDTGLTGLLDIRLCLERHAGLRQWGALVRDGVRPESAGWMHLALRMARDLLQAAVPEELLAALPRPAHLERVVALASTQLWHAGHGTVPYAAARMLAPRTALGRLERICRRLQPRGAERMRATPGGLGFLDGVRATLHELRVFGPIYFRLWRRGDLAPARVARSVELYREKEQLRELMESGIRRAESGPRPLGSAQE